MSRMTVNLKHKKQNSNLKNDLNLVRLKTFRNSSRTQIQGSNNKIHEETLTNRNGTN